jgi:hypothetical protein
MSPAGPVGVAGPSEAIEDQRRRLTALLGWPQAEAGLWRRPVGTPIDYPEEHRLDGSVEQGSYWFDHRCLCLLDLLPAIGSAREIWDIGGGNGFTGLALLDGRYQPVVVEPGDRGVEVARRRGLPLIVHSALQDLQIPQDCIPTAILLDVLEHVREDVSFLGRLNRLMRPGAPLILTVPSFPWLWSSADRRSGHCLRYTASRARRALVAAGFEVERWTYLFAPLVLPVLFGRCVPSLWGRVGGVSPTRVHGSHHLDRGPLARAMEELLRLERWLLRRGRRIPIGTSLLVVARAQPQLAVAR